MRGRATEAPNAARHLDDGALHCKRPFDPRAGLNLWGHAGAQQRLYFFPEPHGHVALVTRAMARSRKTHMEPNGDCGRKMMADNDIVVRRSHGAAKSEIASAARHEQSQRKNNRAQNSHQPTRRCERKTQRFKSLGSAQHFRFIQAAVRNTFNVQRHLTSRCMLRVLRDGALRTWQAATAA